MPPCLIFGVARAIEQQRHPADLEVETDERPHVGAAELKHEAGLGFDEVWILVSLTDVRRDSDFVAADFYAMSARSVVLVTTLSCADADRCERRTAAAPRMRSLCCSFMYCSGLSASIKMDAACEGRVRRSPEGSGG